MRVGLESVQTTHSWSRYHTDADRLPPTYTLVLVAYCLWLHPPDQRPRKGGLEPRLRGGAPHDVRQLWADAVEASDTPGHGPDFSDGLVGDRGHRRSEEHTSELQSLMRISYAVFCLKKKKNKKNKKLSNIYTII